MSTQIPVARLATEPARRDPLFEVADVAARVRLAIVEALRPLASKGSYFKAEIVFNGLDVPPDLPRPTRN